MADAESRDVDEPTLPAREILRLERAYALPENATEVDRLRAVVPVSLKHAQAIQARIDVLEGRLPEALDYFGRLITPGVFVVYAVQYNGRLGHGRVLAVEPYQRPLRWRRVQAACTPPRRKPRRRSTSSRRRRRTRHR
jgi:hypothetical protein